MSAAVWVPQGLADRLASGEAGSIGGSFRGLNPLFRDSSSKRRPSWTLHGRFVNSSKSGRRNGSSFFVSLEIAADQTASVVAGSLLPDDGVAPGRIPSSASAGRASGVAPRHACSPRGIPHRISGRRQACGRRRRTSRRHAGIGASCQVRGGPRTDTSSPPLPLEVAPGSRGSRTCPSRCRPRFRRDVGGARRMTRAGARVNRAASSRSDCSAAAHPHDAPDPVPPEIPERTSRVARLASTAPHRRTGQSAQGAPASPGRQVDLPPGHDPRAAEPGRNPGRGLARR